MKEYSHRCSAISIWLALLCLALLILPVSAQDGDYIGYEPITKIDLGVSSLNLEAGESYTFQVIYEPENTILRTLVWYVTDERVISVDPLTGTITALADGEARIFAESIDGISYAVCDVKVGSAAAKDVSVMKSGADYFGLSGRDLRKITAPSLVRYLDFVADSTLDEESFDHLTDRVFDVLGMVRSGSEKEESRLARELGLDSVPLENLQCVTLTGTLEQILAFVKDNRDLVEVVELGNEWIDDPIVEEQPEEELSGKTVQNKFNLQGQSDVLSGITKAHNLGLKGDQMIIAVVDSGFLTSHEQFLDDNGNTRFIKEACYSSSKGDYYAVCSTDGEGGPGSTFPSLGITKSSHGTHVAGIAAGRDGVAPQAKIIGVAAASEYRWKCSAQELGMYKCSQNSSQCCTYRFFTSNQARAFNYLIDLAKGGTAIDVVNLSIGGGSYKTYCDSTEKVRKELFDKMIEAGMLPVVAAGNEEYNDATNAPGCISNAFTVAALTDLKDPYLASYSNFSETIIDIAAPGTQIYSAVVNNMRGGQVTCTKNCYGYKNGTSMATPMVSGSIVLVKQLYPGVSSLKAAQILKDITSKSVNKRMNKYNSIVTDKFSFSKPVLDLTNLAKWFKISDDAVRAEKGKVSVTFEDTSLQEKYQIRVYDSNNKRVKNVRFKSSVDSDGFRTLDITGSFGEGKLYRLEIKRWFEIAPDKPVKIVKYFYTFPKPKTLTAGIRNNGVILNIHLPSKQNKNHVIYRVYDLQTKKAVRIIDADKENLAQTVSGLNNGQNYSVTAQYYRDIVVRKKNVRVYGTESAPIYFVPLNDSFSCRYGAKLEGVMISCTEDPSVDGIHVLYRKLDNAFAVQTGCTSDKGEFSCTVKDPTLLRGGGQQFIIMKYKYDAQGAMWYSSSTVVTRLGKPVIVHRPENPLIYFTDTKDDVIVSIAETGDANGIVVLGENKDVEFAPYCNRNSRSCVGYTRDYSFVVMRYKVVDGNVYYSPGIYVRNNWGSN